ncbi:iron-sulfur cluster assembly scaffold protein [Calditrichota bacterium]
MPLSPQYVDHFSKPRGIGEVDLPDGIADVEHQGGGCFDKIHLTLRIDDDTLTETRFRARACSGTIAACSALSELTEGMRISDARALTTDDLIAHLHGIPERKEHSVELAMEALKEALQSI